MFASLMFVSGVLTGLLLAQNAHRVRVPIQPDEPIAGVVVGLMPSPWSGDTVAIRERG